MPSFPIKEDKIRFGNAFRIRLVHLMEVSQAEFIKKYGDTIHVKLQTILEKRKYLTGLWKSVRNLILRERKAMGLFDEPFGGPRRKLLASLEQLLLDFPLEKLIESDKFGVQFTAHVAKSEAREKDIIIDQQLDKIEQLKNTLNELQKAHNQLADDHAALQQDAMQSTAYLALNQRHGAAQARLQELATSISNLEIQNTALGEDNDALSQENTLLSNKIIELSNELIKLNTENAEIKSDQQKLETRLTASQQRCDQLEVQIDQNKIDSNNMISEMKKESAANLSALEKKLMDAISKQGVVVTDEASRSYSHHDLAKNHGFHRQTHSVPQRKAETVTKAQKKGFTNHLYR